MDEKLKVVRKISSYILAAIDHNDLETATKLLETVSDQKCPDFCYAHARLYIKQGKFKEAEKCLKEAIGTSNTVKRNVARICYSHATSFTGSFNSKSFVHTISAEFLYYMLIELKEVIFELEQSFQKQKFFDEIVYLFLNKLIETKKLRKATEAFAEFYDELTGLREKLLFAAKNLDLNKIDVLSQEERKLAKFYKHQLSKNQPELLRFLKVVQDDLEVSRHRFTQNSYLNFKLLRKSK